MENGIEIVFVDKEGETLRSCTSSQVPTVGSRVELQGLGDSEFWTVTRVAWRVSNLETQPNYLTAFVHLV